MLLLFLMIKNITLHTKVQATKTTTMGWEKFLTPANITSLIYIVKYLNKIEENPNFIKWKTTSIFRKIKDILNFSEKRKTT